MFSLRLVTRVIAAAALIGGALGEANGQTANKPPTIAEVAKAVASVIDTSLLKTPGAAIAFQSATSHDNVVEMRYVANDPAGFARLKANANQTQLLKAAYFCKDKLLGYLKLGVVVHEVIATPGNSEHVDFTFDKSSCDALPSERKADSNTLTELALTVAKAQNEAAENEVLGKAADAPLRLNGAALHQEIVDEHFIFPDPLANASAQANRSKIAAVVTGYFCAKYRDAISQGLAFHPLFVLADNNPVIDFTIDRSSC
jgi:hypothetical protein